MKQLGTKASLATSLADKRKAVLITGCSSGIGRCVAFGLQARQYRVIASVRKPEDTQSLIDAGIETVLLDLDDPKSIATAVEEVLELTNHQLYGLFNNGAYGQPGAVEDLTWSTLESQLRTNVLGWHELTRLLIPSMRKAGTGRIIQNSSVLGLVAMPYRGAYNCSKFALEGLTDTLRLELDGSGIQVSLIEPGPIASQFRQNAHIKYKANIDGENSIHANAYKSMEERLALEGDASRFTLPPEAVLKRVIHALESKKAKPRYYVTTPTYIFGVLRRFLSTNAIDWLLRKSSGGGKR